MLTMTTALASCPVCTANSTDYGWLILSSTVLGLALLGAGLTAWLDGRNRDAAAFQRIPDADHTSH